MIQMLFSQIQQAPSPDFRKVGKSLKYAVDRAFTQLVKKSRHSVHAPLLG